MCIKCDILAVKLDNIDADTALKLANAASVLYTANFQKQADKLAEAAAELVAKPVRKDRNPEKGAPENGQSESPRPVKEQGEAPSGSYATTPGETGTASTAPQVFTLVDDRLFIHGQDAGQLVLIGNRVLFYPK